MLIAQVASLLSVWTSPAAIAAASDAAGGDGPGTGAPCAPAVVVAGPPEIADRILVLVRGHGVPTETGGCSRPPVRASLAAVPGRRGAYDLEIVDTYGRHIRRRVPDARTAASLIESFAVSEDSMVITPPVAPIPASPVTLPTPDGGRVAARSGPESTAGKGGPDIIPPPTPGTAPALRLLTAAELSIASDHARWYGGTVMACGRVGAFCVGGQASLARDRATNGPLTEGVNAGRTTAHVLAIAAWPSSAGRWSLIPMAGLGLDWMRVSLPASENDPTVSANNLGVRGAAIVVTTFAFSARWALAAVLMASAGGELISSSSSAAFSSRVGAENMAIARTPVGQLHAGLGVAYAH